MGRTHAFAVSVTETRTGVTDFDLLRAALGRPRPREVFLYAFDLLELDGRDMRREPWSDRRWKLARLLRGAGHGVQLSDHMDSTDGDMLFRHASAMGLEGIVAKRRDKPYRSGRSPDWIKVKNPNAPGGSNGGPGRRARLMRWSPSLPSGRSI